MPDKALPTLTVALIAALFSGTMQIFVLLLLAFKMRPAQYIAAFGVSTITGGALAAIGIEQLHLNPFVAGAGAALLGALPAIFIPFIVMRKAMNQIGLKDGDLSSLMDLMAGVPGAPNLHPAPTPPKEEGNA